MNERRSRPSPWPGDLELGLLLGDREAVDHAGPLDAERPFGVVGGGEDLAEDVEQFGQAAGEAVAGDGDAVGVGP